MRYIIRYRAKSNKSITGFVTQEIPCKTIQEARLLKECASPEEKAVIYDTVRKAVLAEP